MLSLTNFVAFNSFHLQYIYLNKILFRACRKDGSYGPGTNFFQSTNLQKRVSIDKKMRTVLNLNILYFTI